METAKIKIVYWKLMSLIISLITLAINGSFVNPLQLHYGPEQINLASNSVGFH